MHIVYDLHRLGWHSFQQLCLTIARELLGQTVQSFLDSNDGGRDGAFAGTWAPAAGECLSGSFVIQCKFTGNANALLAKGDFDDELPKVRKLVAAGVCDIYVLMTNAGVSGNRDAQVRAELLGAGAKHVLIYGPTWIEQQIKEHARLRILVPRVYGLGDLSQILDERAYAQARAVLDSLREDLAKVVITESYRKAVRAIDEHGFVLLIGEPAAGKTTIGSMLAMASADKWKSSVLKLADPAKVVEHWNVDEPSQFIWIDDAFGITQYESTLVHSWNHRMSEVKAMLRQGVKIVMTSRDYIYSRARQDLKESVFPLLNESKVVIDVHDLTLLEKQQILYNHLKLGKQSAQFRAEIKPYLEQVASHMRFIPETARRIADPVFTRDLFLSDWHLKQFVEKREQLLIEVIQGLDAHSKAALGLVYMRKDRLESPVTLLPAETHALERLGSTLGDCIRALGALNGSLVTLVQIDDQSVWRFKHPTVGDAYSSTLAFSSDLLAIFLSGSTVESLTAQITCGNVGFEKAVIVPKSLFPMMVQRLRGFTASEKYKAEWNSAWGARWTLRRFLASRCSKDFLALYLEEDPELLDRVSEPGLRLSVVPEVDLAIRLHEFGLLPEEKRRKFIETVSKHAISGEDEYALGDDSIRRVFTTSEFEDLMRTVRKKLLPRLPDVRREVQGSYLSTDPPDEHMQSYLENLRWLQRAFGGDMGASKIIARETKRANEWVAATEEPEGKVQPRVLGTTDAPEESLGTRSIFDDIDH